MLNSIDVSIWGHSIGQLLWNCSKGISCFHFKVGLQEPYNRVAPLLREGEHGKELIVDGLDLPLYHGLPSFIADSLPDTSKLYYHCLDKASPNYRAFYELSQIGDNGMGALDYKSEIPTIKKNPLRLTRFKQVGDCYSLASEIAIDETIKHMRNPLGGRKHKVFLTLNTVNQEIIIGSPESQEGSEHFILKYNESGQYDSILEYIYYLAAVRSGIRMTRSFLVNINGIQHFLTKRFDIHNGGKMHTQTLAAISPSTNNYEGLFSVAKRIGVPRTDYTELFKRMIFNILANNTDDHTKNFTFLMDKKGKWSLAPAYDLLFSFEYKTFTPQTSHTLSVNNKRSGIILSDVIDIANEYGINQPIEIINDVIQSLKQSPNDFLQYGLRKDHAKTIMGQIHRNIECLTK